VTGRSYTFYTFHLTGRSSEPVEWTRLAREPTSVLHTTSRLADWVVNAFTRVNGSAKIGSTSDYHEAKMTDTPEPSSLAHHLSHLAADADDVEAFLSRAHVEGGDIHPEALGKSERLATSLRDVIHALTEHEHLAMGADDVWKGLTVKHSEVGEGTIG